MDLVEAVHAISFGGGGGFGGLEGIAVALAGLELGCPVGVAISDLAEAINNHADAVSAVAEAIRERKGA